MTFAGGKIEAQIGVGAILGHLILWLLLTIVTFGFALMFFPYSFAKFIINRCYVYDDEGHRLRMQCELNVFSQFGHIIGWFFLSIITFGIAYVFYLYKVWNYALNHTTIRPG